MVRSSNPGRGKRFFSSHNHPDGFGAHQTSYLMGNEVLSLGIGWPGCDVDPSPPSSVKVNEWSQTCTPPTCLHGINRKNRTFFPPRQII